MGVMVFTHKEKNMGVMEVFCVWWINVNLCSGFNFYYPYPRKTQNTLFFLSFIFIREICCFSCNVYRYIHELVFWSQIKFNYYKFIGWLLSNKLTINEWFLYRDGNIIILNVWTKCRRTNWQQFQMAYIWTMKKRF